MNMIKLLFVMGLWASSALVQGTENPRDVGRSCWDISSPERCRFVRDCRWDERARVCRPYRDDDRHQCRRIHDAWQCDLNRQCRWNTWSRSCQNRLEERQCRHLRTHVECHQHRYCRWDEWEGRCEREDDQWPDGPWPHLNIPYL